MVSWQGATAAEYALVKGKTYTFSLSWVATDPEYDDTPKPDYDWCCLINGSTDVGVCAGLYSTGAFIVEDPGRLLTELTSGNESNITLGREGKIIVPKIVTETVATSPSDRTRKTVGVGEEVTLTLLPEGMSGVLWNMTEGSGQISGYTGDTITFTAPDRATNTTLTVDTDAGTIGSVTFHVIEPTYVLMENDGVLTAGSGISSGIPWVGMQYWGKYYLQPDTVNFQNVKLYEGASDVHTNGYFSIYPPSIAKAHESNGPHTLAGAVVDGKGTPGDIDDQIGGTIDIFPSPLEGDLYWDILWSFSVGQGQQKGVMTLRQNFHIDYIDEVPRLTITKGQSGYRIIYGTNNVTSVY